MLLQLLSRRSNSNPLETDGTVKDPKNPNSVALLLIPLVPAAMPLLDAADPVRMLTLAAPIAAAAVAVGLLIIGLAAETKWKASDTIARPRIPAKILGAIALGVTIALLVLVHTDGGYGVAVTKGVIGAVLAALAFGIDPLKDKGLATISDRERFAVSTRVEEVRARLERIVKDIDCLENKTATEAAQVVASSVMRLTRAVMLDPKRHRMARRHLGPIFDGTEKSAGRFATLWTISPEPSALAEFDTLARQLADEFNRAAVSYAHAGADELKVEAAVLRDMIKREAH